MTSGERLLIERACPFWCELPADHDIGEEVRLHRAAVFEIDDRAHVSVAQPHHRPDPAREGQAAPVDIDFRTHGSFTIDEAMQIHHALQAAYQRHDEILRATHARNRNRRTRLKRMIRRCVRRDAG
jgi:hypothetical protein